MTNQEIRQKLLLAGVKNLTEFGYQSVNTESGKILAKGGICSTTVDSSTNDG